MSTDSGETNTRGQEGQTLSEYALVLAFICAVCIFAAGALAVVVAGEWQNFVNLFPK